jgi:hypothetical protein
MPVTGVSASRLDDIGERADHAAVGEDVAAERVGRGLHLRLQRALEQAADVGGRLEVAVLVEPAGREARPVDQDAATIDRAVEQQGGDRGAVAGAVGCDDAAEFGDDDSFLNGPDGASRQNIQATVIIASDLRCIFLTTAGCHV